MSAQDKIAKTMKPTKVVRADAGPQPYPPAPQVMNEDQVAAYLAEPAADEPVGPGLEDRVPFGSQRQKLQFEARPGFKNRIFNDWPGQIEQAMRAGYRHVKNETSGQPVTRTVGSAQGGGGLTGYLMEIPIEIYEADQRLKDKPLQDFDASIRRGAVNNVEPGQDGRYVPKDAYGRSRIVIRDGRR